MHIQKIELGDDTRVVAFSVLLLIGLLFTPSVLFANQSQTWIQFSFNDGELMEGNDEARWKENATSVFYCQKAITYAQSRVQNPVSVRLKACAPGQTGYTWLFWWSTVT
ncbi:hypothetical protein AZF37_00235 [endosymbiont 'TC1' of Trimyema compressum]|uniref:hypothetical protein n=1 Tax=endosymbiont 'TC1' of Trimyema compressum TaxID=243899 RepID=UPI0007F11721|nr:hypothetical protein [endosymbiont 'TC1' of Trimyema compressum]AMP19810.1 hypothetical protein AZF37_00235 [endosymbiont 'TC1' of Trimyema compressum]